MKPIRYKKEVPEHSTDSPENPSAEGPSPDLSSDAQQIRSKQDQMKNLPEIREDRITQIRHAIKKGTYSVPTEQVAKKIIQEL